MRARNLKPGFFSNEELLECDPLARLLFAGLWCIADRAGRLEDRPKRIKIELLPVDNCDINDLLRQLHEHGLIIRYQAGREKYIQIPAFSRHQTPHVKEKPSIIPPYTDDNNQTNTGEASDKNPIEEHKAPDKSDASTGQAQDKHQPKTDQHPLNPESPYLNPESSRKEGGEKAASANPVDMIPVPPDPPANWIDEFTKIKGWNEAAARACWDKFVENNQRKTRTLTAWKLSWCQWWAREKPVESPRKSTRKVL